MEPKFYPGSPLGPPDHIIERLKFWHILVFAVLALVVFFVEV